MSLAFSLIEICDLLKALKVATAAEPLPPPPVPEYLPQAVAASFKWLQSHRITHTHTHTQTWTHSHMRLAAD